MYTFTESIRTSEEFTDAGPTIDPSVRHTTVGAAALRFRLMRIYRERTCDALRTNPQGGGWWWIATEEDADRLHVAKSTISRWRSRLKQDGHIETRRDGRILYVRATGLA